MTKFEIQKKIFGLKNDEEIIEFINNRIKEFENSTEETTAGQNYTTTFNEFISSKVHYKPAAKLGQNECPDLVYDDLEPYISLVKTLIDEGGYNELTLFSTIFWNVHNYFSSENSPIDIDRYLAYKSHENTGKISVKEIKKAECGRCSEKSGLSHNMFKLLGINSSLIVGTINGTPHAFNLIYPKGYDEKTVAIFDPSFHIDFINEANKKFSFGCFRILSEEEYDKLMQNEKVSLDLSPSGERIKKLFSKTTALDGFEMLPQRATYTIGLPKTQKLDTPNLDDETCL